MPDAPTYTWLDPATVRSWVKIDESHPKAPLVEACRVGAADWIQDQRPDLLVTSDEVSDVVEEDVNTSFAATARIKLAGLIATARLFSRVDSPNGVVSFDELGAPGSILSRDPDVTRMLGRVRRPVVG